MQRLRVAPVLCMSMHAHVCVSACTCVCAHTHMCILFLLYCLGWVPASHRLFDTFSAKGAEPLGVRSMSVPQLWDLPFHGAATKKAVFISSLNPFRVPPPHNLSLLYSWEKERSGGKFGDVLQAGETASHSPVGKFPVMLGARPFPAPKWSAFLQGTENDVFAFCICCLLYSWDTTLDACASTRVLFCFTVSGHSPKRCEVHFSQLRIIFVSSFQCSSL